MKTIYQEVQEFLQKYPRARERRYKDEALVFMLRGRYPYLETMTERISFAQDYASFDRAWRKVLQDHEGLRGKDYADKAVLEQEKQIDLGYEIGDRSKELHL